MFLYGGSDIDDQINRLFDTPHIASVKGEVALMKKMKIVVRMTSSKILKMISSQWNKLGNS